MKRLQLTQQTPARAQQIDARVRAGFTLVELLVVIVIMAILMALILPAIGSVRRSAQVAAVSAEMTQLDSAITNFKQIYGPTPPSNLIIPANANSWGASDRAVIRALWPQFDFSTCGGLQLSNGAVGYPANPVHMSGAECLVFFLGGVDSDATDSVRSLIGFSKNPATPWSNLGSNRDNPLFKFDVGRLVDIDKDGAVEYLDSLPDQATPYAFFSSQGKNYRKLNSATVADDFDVHGAPTNPKDMTAIYLDPSNAPLEAGGYQLVSPGLDGAYGVGGVYTDGKELTGNRVAETDNITNFSKGVLGK